jgi:hypothetical protein
MVIEFIGLPGSGKSTAVEVVRAGLKASGKSTLERVDMLVEFGGRGRLRGVIGLFSETIFNANNIRLIAAIFLYVYSIRNATVRRWAYFPAMIRMSLAFRAAVSKRGKRFIVLDQGLAQMLWAVVIKAERRPLGRVIVSSRRCSRVIELLYSNVNVVFVRMDVPVDVSINRISGREEAFVPFPHLGEEEKRYLFNRHMNVMCGVERALRCAGMTVFLVDGEKTCDDLMSIII